MTDLPALISRLPPLDRSAQFRSSRRCKICQREAISFDQVDFNKCCSVESFYDFGLSGIPIHYSRCLFCGFIFSESFDNWSPDEFANLIYNSDYVKVDGDYLETRPTQFATAFAHQLRGCEKARILDYGSGSGTFVGRMREHGFRNIEAYDPFSSPERPPGAFDIITCFEVIEHSIDPIGIVGDMRNSLCEDGCIIFSQTVQPPEILAIRGNWWYLAPRNGHVSTFSEESLVELARRNGMLLHKGANLYGFAPVRPSKFAGRALSGVGPSLTTCRLLAPGAEDMTDPLHSTPVWQPVESDGIWLYRWTGGKSISWESRWESASILQVRVPFFQEAQPGFAAGCTFELRGKRMPARVDRGELTAEFDVSGCKSGLITLHPPEATAPKRSRWHKPAAKPVASRGLAILISQAPLRPDV